MNALLNTLRRPGLGAPVLAAMLLGLIGWRGGIDAEAHDHTGPYFADVAAAVDALPYRVGRWVGIDVEPSPSAIKLLKPNRILQRRFVDPATGEAISLLIVHCGDVRDMLGHYPPVCYPAHGWRLDRSRAVQVPLATGAAEGQLYWFSRRDELSQRACVILNFFVLPDPASPIAPDMDALEAASGATDAVRLGAAQIQVLREGTSWAAESDPDLRQFLEALEPIIRAVAAGGIS